MNYLKFDDFSPKQATDVVSNAIALKAKYKAGVIASPLTNKVMTMLFTQPSTRTRVSFEASMAQLGGSTIYLSSESTQLSRGEPVSDTARVISSMCDMVVIRTYEHNFVKEFAEVSSVPVINALTNLEHPCQVLADVMTYIELRGDIKDAKVAWVGDFNNVCRSWIKAAELLGFTLAIATPKGYLQNHDDYLQSSKLVVFEDPKEAVTDATCVVTDTWQSMSDKSEVEQKALDFKDHCVTTELMSNAHKDAVFMHCLPAYRDKEVATEVIDGAQSVVWQEAENRLHIQKTLIEFLLTK